MCNGPDTIKNCNSEAPAAVRCNCDVLVIGRSLCACSQSLSLLSFNMDSKGKWAKRKEIHHKHKRLFDDHAVRHVLEYGALWLPRAKQVGGGG